MLQKKKNQNFTQVSFDKIMHIFPKLSEVLCTAFTCIYIYIKNLSILFVLHTTWSLGFTSTAFASLLLIFHRKQRRSTLRAASTYDSQASIKMCRHSWLGSHVHRQRFYRHHCSNEHNNEEQAPPKETPDIIKRTKSGAAIISAITGYWGKTGGLSVSRLARFQLVLTLCGLGDIVFFKKKKTTQKQFTNTLCLQATDSEVFPPMEFHPLYHHVFNKASPKIN